MSNNSYFRSIRLCHCEPCMAKQSYGNKTVSPLLLLAVTLLIILFTIHYPLSTICSADNAKEQESYLIAKGAYQDGLYDASEKLLESFLENYPLSPYFYDAQFYLAQCLLKGGQAGKAQQILDKLEREKLSTSLKDKVLFSLAQVYVQADDLRQADKYFNKVIRGAIDPSLFLDAKVFLAEVFIKEGKLKQAEKILHVLIANPSEVIQKQSFLYRGECLLGLGNYSLALENYKALLNKFSDIKELDKVYFHMAEANYYLNNLDEAIKYYIQAQTSTQDEVLKAMSLQGLAWIYLKTNQLSKAKDAFDKIEALGLEEKRFNQEMFLLGKAVLFFNSNDFTQAFNYYDLLVTTYPRSSLRMQALLGKAESLMKLSRLKEAIDIYLVLIGSTGRKTPEREMSFIDDARYNLGLAYLDLGDIYSALAAFKNVISLCQDNDLKIKALYMSGEIYQKNKDFERAIEMYEDILNNHPQVDFSDNIQYQLGAIMLEKGDFDKAILAFKSLNRKFTTSDFLDDANYYLGYVYFKKGDFGNVIRQLQAFLSVFADSSYKSRASYLLALSLFKNKEYEKAIAIFSEVAGNYPQDEDLAEKCHYEIGRSLSEMGKMDEASDKFKEFIKIYPKSVLSCEVMFWLGDYYYKKNEFVPARKSFEEIIRYSQDKGDIGEAWYRMGLSFEEEGKYLDAERIFKRLITEDSSDEVKVKAIPALKDLYKRDAVLLPEILYFLQQVKSSCEDKIKAQIQFYIAECLEEKNDLENAASEYSSITGFSETDTRWAVKGLLCAGRIYEEMGKRQQAIEVYNKVSGYDVPEKGFAIEKMELIKKESGV